METGNNNKRPRSNSTEFRRKQKDSNPEKYEQYLEYQREQSRRRREELKKSLNRTKPSKADIEKQEKIRLLNRIRQQKFREKNKQVIKDQQKNKMKETEKAESKLKVVFKPNTRNEQESQRKKWREQKQIFRDNLKQNPQKYRRFKERDRLRKKLIRSSTPQVPTDSSDSDGFKSKKTKWNIISNIRKNLPRTPEKFAGVVKGLITNCSPRRRKALDRHRDESSANLESSLKHAFEKLKTTPDGKRAVKLISSTMLETPHMKEKTLVNLGVSKKRLKHPINRRKRSDAITTTVKSKVYSFFLSIARPLPHKRYVTKYGPGYLLLTSLAEAYRSFKKQHPQIKLGFRKFVDLKPKQVRLLKKSYWDACVCPYCINIAYKLNILNRYVVDEKKLKNEQALVEMLLCPKYDGAFPAAMCVHGMCDKCSNYRDTITEYYKGIDLSQNVKWTHWEKVSDEDGKTKRDLVVIEGDMQDLLNELISDVAEPLQNQTFILHLFIANWQFSQYKHIKQNLPDGTILMVLDFAQNYAVVVQDAIKSQAFSHKQITIHPIVVFYKHNSCVARMSLIFLTDDKKHDFHAVEHFKRLAINYCLSDLTIDDHAKRIITFSDGCASQYKSKGPFFDISISSPFYEHHFFGSEHGKGECDGEGGVIKSAITRAVIGRQAIVQTAHDMYDYCTNHLSLDTPLSKRHFFLVDSVNRNRPQTENLRPLSGTRKIHHVQSLGQPGQVQTRQLSCFCYFCEHKKFDACINVHYVGSPIQQTLLKFKAVDELNYQLIMQDLASTTNPISFTQKCFVYDRKIPELEQVLSPAVVDIRGVVDKVALDLLPELKDITLYPVCVIGDGNCLPRSLSVAVYGDEDHHEEMRVRLSIEMIINKQKYTNNEYLLSGFTHSANLVNSYTMFSPFYIPPKKITTDLVEDVYMKEAMDTAKDGSFLGIWQLFAASTVMNSQVFSVYPERGNPNVRKELHRVIQPIQRNLRGEILSKRRNMVYVMWSSCRMDMTHEHWIPNHFVPLLPLLSTQADINSVMELELIEGNDNGILIDITEQNFEKEDTHRLQAGMFVMISLPYVSGKREKTFVAEILDVRTDEKEVWLKYMVKQDDKYFWPEKDDCSLEPIERIKRILSPPTPTVVGSRLKFHFNDLID